jgi:crotonobetainyl-CoA:carnitine CoA-transferase CaiB-like acyl-CoA transferase
MASRLVNNDELTAMVFAWMADKQRVDLYHELQRNKVPSAFVHDVDDLLASEHLNAREFWRQVEHPGAGEATHPGAPIRFADVEIDYDPAPSLGEHTEEILADIDISGAEMADMRQRGVI